METKYDWIERNKTTVRQLRADLCSKHMREGMSRSRSMIAASDYIGPNIMQPPKSGQELDKWLGNTNGDPTPADMNKAKREGTLYLFEPTIDHSVKVVEGLTPPEVRGAGGGRLWQAAWEILRDLPIGEWKAIQLSDPVAVTRCQTSLNTHAKVELHGIENGWKLRTSIDKNHPGVLWMIKIKIA
jgi:hypothetical protein